MAKLELDFQHDGKNTDGSVFDSPQFAGVTYSLDGAPAVSVPADFAADGSYAVALDVALLPGNHAVAVAIKHADGTTSASSNVAPFTVAAREPTAPFGLSVTYSA